MNEETKKQLVQNEINTPAETPQFEEAREETTPDKMGVIDSYEHVNDPNSSEAETKLREGRALFERFAAEYINKFDLSDKESIDKILAAAEKFGIYDKAKEIRELLFGKNISVYGVAYLSNMCDEQCKFCPMGVACHEMDHLMEELKRPDITPEEEDAIRQKHAEFNKKIRTIRLYGARKEFEALREIGHEEICILSGSGRFADWEKMIPYVQLALDQPGIKEVILNIGQYPEGDYESIIESLHIPEGVKLQWRIFQETYVPETYKYYMEHGKGKKNANMRRQTQTYALKEGFDEAGIGALFGLDKNPLKELIGLIDHADEIKRKTGHSASRCCLPVANEPCDNEVDIQYSIEALAQSDQIKELIYALARLALDPNTSIVMSERDQDALLQRLEAYANHTTLYVHSDPGGNVRSLREHLGLKPKNNEVIPVGQANTYGRQVKPTLKRWLIEGRNILDFNWQKYFSKNELLEIEASEK
ncbi:MAG: hypothetical protein WCO23_01300 [bacterium]